MCWSGRVSVCCEIHTPTVLSALQNALQHNAFQKNTDSIELMSTRTRTQAKLERRLYPILGGGGHDDTPTVGQVLGGLSRSGVYNLVKQGRLTKVSIGRRAFCTAESIEAFLEGLH